MKLGIVFTKPSNLGDMNHTREICVCKTENYLQIPRQTVFWVTDFYFNIAYSKETSLQKK